MRADGLRRWAANSGLVGGSLLLLIGLLIAGCNGLAGTAATPVPTMLSGGIPTMVAATFAPVTLGPLYLTTPTVPSGAPILPPVLPTTGGLAGRPTAAPTEAALPAGDEGAVVGRLAPDMNLTLLDSGQTVKLSSFRGKPVWINFWATWCPPCKQEMPVMERIIAAHKNSDLVVLGVDTGEDAGTVRPFVTAAHYSWTFALDPGNRGFLAYAVDGIPTHFYVDRQGVLRDTVAAPMTPAQMETHLAAILQ